MQSRCYCTLSPLSTHSNMSRNIDLFIRIPPATLNHAFNRAHKQTGCAPVPVSLIQLPLFYDGQTVLGVNNVISVQSNIAAGRVQRRRYLHTRSNCLFHSGLFVCFPNSRSFSNHVCTADCFSVQSIFAGR